VWTLLGWVFIIFYILKSIISFFKDTGLDGLIMVFFFILFISGEVFIFYYAGEHYLDLGITAIISLLYIIGAFIIMMKGIGFLYNIRSGGDLEKTDLSREVISRDILYKGEKKTLSNSKCKDMVTKCEIKYNADNVSYNIEVVFDEGFEIGFKKGYQFGFVYTFTSDELEENNYNIVDDFEEVEDYGDFEEGYIDGYLDGYKFGYKSCYEDGDYENYYLEGFLEGFRTGYYYGCMDSYKHENKQTTLNNSGYDYNLGYESGFNKGYEDFLK